MNNDYYQSTCSELLSQQGELKKLQEKILNYQETIAALEVVKRHYEKSMLNKIEVKPLKKEIQGSKEMPTKYDRTMINYDKVFVSLHCINEGSNEDITKKLMELDGGIQYKDYKKTYKLVKDNTLKLENKGLVESTMIGLKKFYKIK